MRITSGQRRSCGPFLGRMAAFTLIEMLTVIAIIGVLTAILLPTIGMIRGKARQRSASAGISNIASAMVQYEIDFGAFPPDSSDCLPNGAGEPFEDMNTPNECMVWFLTRSFDKTEGAGVPNLAIPGDEWAVPPQNSLKVYARVTGGPYLDIKAKQKRDYDGDGFYEFLDPWGRPYMYHAYLDDWQGASASVDAGDDTILNVTLSLAVPPDMPGITGVRGRIQLRNMDPWNGAFDFEGAGDDTIRIQFSSPQGGSASGEFRFLLHNNEGVDIYSLGPNGKTRVNAAPSHDGDTLEWEPQNTRYLRQVLDPGPPTVIYETYAQWEMIWGTPGDGNDVVNTGNIGIANEKDRDDINNW